MIELSSRYFDTLKVRYPYHEVSRYFDIDTIWPSSSLHVCIFSHVSALIPVLSTFFLLSNNRFNMSGIAVQ